ncbi:hypothetical protein [Mesorhizobium sp. DCY119]|uniref:hypothetical protein n=1 Tax=Mesorhizobium sp. DCY119 TaxID=2108445 RepID=UPI000E6B7BCA|nr:hypothetical protein [Mesorhizobium sp. DCY119]
MREFSKISPQLWNSKRFRKLDNDDARYFYLYLLSCEHQTSAGCFRLPVAYAANDLNWETDRVQDSCAILGKSDMILHDADTDEVFIRRWFRHSPPTNKKHAAGIRSYIDRLESEFVAEAADDEFLKTEWGLKFTESPSSN